jgi:pimeloyl-ACP methyl ester carboxylesterase
MRYAFSLAALVILLAAAGPGVAQVAPEVIDLPTRAGVTQRFIFLAPEGAKAAVILFAGSNGGLQIQPDGKIASLGGNFLVRMRNQFVQHGLAVAVVDAPSDRPAPNFLAGFRQSSEHVADIEAVIAWVRKKTALPVWLVGTSRGTQSVAFIATELTLAKGGPDGLVLSSTIMRDKSGRAVPLMPLERIAIPVLVVHHQEDGCSLTPYSEVDWLMGKLSSASPKELIKITGGDSRGDPCEGFSHHGFYGQDTDVAGRIASWIELVSPTLPASRAGR